MEVAIVRRTATRRVSNVVIEGCVDIFDEEVKGGERCAPM
jgi:hypothetical protein